MHMDPKAPTTTTYRGLGLPPTLRTPSFGVSGAAAHRYQPGSSLEDPLIVEIGSRILRAGFSNEASPRCQLAWNDTIWRRSGDRVVTELVGRRQGGKAVWNLDFALYGEAGEDVDKQYRRQLGLVEDLVERGLRLAYNKHLLLDSKSRRIILPIPPLFPTRILTAIIATIFVHFQPPAVALMSAPVLATVAAGLRSALIVDIGWEETVVTPVYDLRTIEGRGIGVHGRSVRGIKVLRGAWISFLTPFLRECNDPLDISEVEEIMEHMSYIPSPDGTRGADKVMSIPVGRVMLKIPFSQLATPAEKVFFAATSTPTVTPDLTDDDDAPLPLLLYHALLYSAVDVRSACVPRIVFVGGGSRIPGLQTRVLHDLQKIINERGWVLGLRGLNSSPSTSGANSSQSTPRANTFQSTPRATSPSTPRANTPNPPQEEDKENYHESEEELPAKEKEDRLDMHVRGVKSLGVWAGGSLVAGLKVKAKVEIEREKFLNDVAKGGSGLPLGW